MARSRLSLRARLTLWNAAILAFVLGAGAASGYAFIAFQTRAIADEFLFETANALADDITLERAAGTSDSLAIVRAVREFQFRDIAVAVFAAADAHPIAQGTSVAAPTSVLQAQVRMLLSGGIQRGARAVPGRAGSFASASVEEPGEGETRAGLLPIRIGEGAIVIGVAQRLRLRARMLEQARNAMLVAFPLAIVIVAAGGLVIARHGLSPVTRMRERAEHIEATTLHERLPVEAPPHDELGRLARVFNALLERLARAFDQQRRFMADASHELRTPVAIMRGETEHALAVARPERDLRDALIVVQREAARMTHIVEDLFLLARADAGDQIVVPAELYLDDLALQCARAVRSLASAKRIELASDVSPDLQMRGDEALLRRLLINLLDNAIKYTPEGGRVAIRASREESNFRIAVSDSGQGMPADVQAHLFERFRRGQDGRTRDTPGAGLGLAIVRWVARAHRGDARLVSSGASGTTVEVVLQSL